MQNKLKPLVSLVLILALGITTLTACTTKQSMDTSPKIAVIRNVSNDDHTQQYLEGAVAEGNMLGFTVDTFVTNGNDNTMQETLQQAINSDYQGLIVSHAKEEYAYQLLKTARDKGMQIVTFDTIMQDLEGVTATAQNDAALARLSLDALINQTPNHPAKIIKVWYDQDLAPFAKRNAVYQEYEQKGLIQTVAEIYPQVPADQLQDTVAKEIKALGNMQADGIWAAWDELAKGAYHGMLQDNGFDIPMVSIDISDEDMQNMVANPSLWQGTAAVNAQTIGMIDMRILAKKLKGEKTPSTYEFEPAYISSSDLTAISTVSNLGNSIKEFGHSDDFWEDWMEKLRNANLKRVVFLTYDSAVLDNSFNQISWNGLNALSQLANISYHENRQAEAFSQELTNILTQKPDLIWSNGMSTADVIAQAAAKYPDISFAVTDKAFSNPPDNLTGLTFRSHEGAYLAGYAAAKTSQTNIIGFIGGKAEAAIQQFEYGYKAGAQYANPQITILTNYTDTYSDETKGQEVAKQQYTAGADVIFQAAGQCGLGVIAAARELNHWVIGVDLDQNYLAPDQVLTSVMKNTGLALEQITKDYLKNKPIGGKNYSLGLKEGGIRLAPSHGHMDEHLMTELKTLQEKIISNTIKVPQNKAEFTQ